MIDGIIRGDGTSRRVQATLPATYEEFRSRAANGTLLLDLLINAAGWTQQPTFLNKANLLDDTTAALGGYGTGVTPNQVFRDLLATPPPASGYATDFYLYITGQHPVLSQNPYQDIHKVKWELIRKDLARTVSLSGDAQTLTLYDGGAL